MSQPDRVIPEVTLREVVEADLPAFYQDQLDPEAAAMVGFESRDWDAFLAHWTKILADPATAVRTVVVDGQVAGNVLSFEWSGEREVGYWIGKRFWGRGVATLALAEFLRQYPQRPLFATVAAHNAGSIRVLRKCGFTDSASPPDAKDAKDVKDAKDDEVRLRLDG
ncbi:MAG: GNAT family N-acetyltransferase [Sporichthyaceae bacterium]|nr:GNAT family N-acetyltransferase [Sporichthyaceae bacterium]